MTELRSATEEVALDGPHVVPYERTDEASDLPTS